MTTPGGIDRLTIRQRPALMPVMHQAWCKLLFMHWRLPPELLESRVPPPLELDTCDGSAWISITPFVVRDLRPVFLPSLPWLCNFNEVNVRTYVHHQGVPGVWFFSLDADSLAAVVGARGSFRLPYHYAKMSFREVDDRIFYSSSRADSAEPARLEVSWRKGGSLGVPREESLEFFLVERYCLYATDQDHHLYRARIHHAPWELHDAELATLRSTMLEAQRLPRPQGPPLLHYAERRDVSVWPLKRIW